jgi:Na+/melibiose symporter-like transporter
VRSASFLGLAAVTWFSPGLPPWATLALFLAFVFVFSISGGFAGIAYTDLIGKTIPGDQRPGLFAWRQVFSGVASLLGALVVAWLFSPQNLAFPANYTVGLVIGAAGLWVGAFGFWAIREPEPAAGTLRPKMQSLLKDVAGILKQDRRFLWFLVLENTTAFSLMVLPFYMVFLKRTFPDSAGWLGLFVFAQASGAILSNLLWAWFSKRFGSKTVVRVCIALGASLPLMAWGLSFTGPAWFAGLFFLVGFVLSGRNIGFEPYLLEIAPEHQRTLYLGIRGTLNILLVFLPLAGGAFIAAFGFVPTFMVVSGFMALAFLFTFRKESSP